MEVLWENMSQCPFIHHTSHMNWPGIELYTHNSRHSIAHLSICWLLGMDWALDYESRNLCRQEGSRYHMSRPELNVQAVSPSVFVPCSVIASSLWRWPCTAQVCILDMSLACAQAVPSNRIVVPVLWYFVLCYVWSKGRVLQITNSINN
jgi:hypothetical protein